MSRQLIFCLRVRGEVGYAILTQIFSCACLSWRGMISQPFLEHHSLLLTLRPVSPLFRVVQLPFRADPYLLLFSLLSSWLSPSHYTTPLTTCHFELRDPEKNGPSLLQMGETSCSSLPKFPQVFPGFIQGLVVGASTLKPQWAISLFSIFFFPDTGKIHIW